MSTAPSTSPVAVSGAGGFIGSAVVRRLGRKPRPAPREKDIITLMPYIMLSVKRVGSSQTIGR